MARPGFRCEGNIKMDIKYDVRVWNELIWFGTGDGLSRIGNGHLVSIND
jgi:hypothetical protein